MERFELNETLLKLYKNKKNNLKKLKFKNVFKGFIYSENSQYAGCIALDKNLNIIYFEAMDTLIKSKDVDTIISNSINLLNAQSITLPNNLINIVIKYQQNGFRVVETTKKEVKLQKGYKKEEDNP